MGDLTRYGGRGQRARQRTYLWSELEWIYNVAGRSSSGAVAPQSSQSSQPMVLVLVIRGLVGRDLWEGHWTRVRNREDRGTSCAHKPHWYRRRRSARFVSVGTSTVAWGCRVVQKCIRTLYC